MYEVYLCNGRIIICNSRELKYIITDRKNKILGYKKYN